MKEIIMPDDIKNVDEKKILPVCVQCGYCCTVRPCFYGIWNPDKKACNFLADHPDGIRRVCRLFDAIRKDQQDAIYPMFWGGCEAPLFNTIREETIKKIRGKTDEQKKT
ncbi:MAG: hypothetical protein M0Q24_11045 [Sulfurimonas sp.]|uniref:hypothetical protein n=1 Tax=Sulfurimonas sp. TaxID=2022749 RepID=UPI0025D2C190|nr:hypothetical protein [Sulfurimonas sp.]MCK9492610.1 hypothetical protein [Sulfurimonas sp.]